MFGPRLLSRYRRINTGRSHRRSLILFNAVLATSVLLVACGGDENDDGGGTTSSDVESVTLGLAGSKTGFMAPYDIPVQEAIKLAIQDVNAEGGIQFETVDADSKTDPAESAKAALQVLDEGADVVVTSCDFDIGGPAAVEAQKQDRLGFGTCAASLSFGPQGVGPLAFTMATSGFTQGAVMAEWGFQEQEYENAYVLEDTTIEFDSQTCQGFRDRFEELGGTIIGEDTFSGEDESIAAQITRLKGGETPEAIYLCSIPPGGSKALRQLRAADIDAPVLSSENFDGEFWKDAVPNASDVYFTTYGSIYGDDPDPEVNDFIDRLEKEMGERPDFGGALTGVALVQALQLAVEQAGSTEGPALQEALEQFEDVELIVGETSFSPEFHINIYRPSRIMQVQDGKTSFVQVWKPESVPVSL